MAGRIPREFIDDLIARVDLVDLIEARIPLKKAGSNYQARCPFHSEKTPSFNVNRDKQLYHCFGCGAHGNAIGFLMDYERQSFVEAVETLADSLGLDVPREAETGERRERETEARPLYEVQEQAAEFYARQLREHPEAARAREYLKRRGLSGEIAKRFQLGFAPPGWRSLPDTLSAENLLAAGLFISKEGGQYYDRFRDRIMFPIRDRRGRVIGFGGRVLGEETPKYLNSPETPLFKKHKEVYGLFELLESRQKIERILVVEGYMDVIALAQHDIHYAVATLGTATSADHATLLFRYARELVFCFDGDKAGRNAAWKALEASLPALREGRSIRFLMLPEGHDPDSLVREQGREDFEQRLAKAQPLSDYFFQHLSEDLDLGSIEGRASLYQAAKQLIDKLPQGVFREMMQSRLKELTGYGKVEAQASSARLKPWVQKSDSSRARPSTLRVILALLIQNPNWFELIDLETRSALRRAEKAGILVTKLFELLDEKPDIRCAGIEERFREEAEDAQVKKLSAMEIPLSGEEARAEFRDALAQFCKQQREKRLEALLAKQAREGLGEEERIELKHLFKQQVTKS
ncbi:MAG: DNA primase [Methylococcaceae bacterium]|nr:DNA primase [Methylococcaceae bacterium]